MKWGFQNHQRNNFLVIFLECISIVLQIGLKLLKDIQDTVGGWLLPQGD
jgi:hypothetical protein